MFEYPWDSSLPGGASLKTDVRAPIYFGQEA